MSKFFVGGLLALALVLGGFSFAQAQETAGLPQDIQDLINQLAHNVIGGGGSVNTTVVGNTAGNTLQLGAGGNINTYISHGVDGADKLLVDGDIIARENGTNGGGLIQGEKYVCVGKGNNNHCIGGEATDRQYYFMEKGAWCGAASLNSILNLPLVVPNSFPCLGSYVPPNCPPHFTMYAFSSGLAGVTATCLYDGSGN